MSETTIEQSPKEAKKIVRKFYDSLALGRMIDALDLLATDATLQDEKGSESRGIRAIATTLLPYREPHAISLESLEGEGPDVKVVFRTKKRRQYRGSFSVDRGRIRSLRFERK